MEQLESDSLCNQGSVEDIRASLAFITPGTNKENFERVGSLQKSFMYESAHHNRSTVKKLIKAKIKQLCKPPRKK